MAKSFIPVKEAKALVSQHCMALEPIAMPLTNALHTVLAADVFSPIDMPAFEQSAMDGYAFIFNDYKPGELLDISGESFAGTDKIFTVKPHSAARIFTGAPLPAMADTVVMQEQIQISGNQLLIQSDNLTRGSNVRKQGSEIKKGALALEKGNLITPGAIGFLTSLGLTRVKVYPFPRTTIIVTGKELATPGTPLSPGQVYESNSITLKTALEQLHLPTIKVHWADDDLDAMVTIAQLALDEADLILITGGVSVGDYDFVVPALAKCDVTTIFHKVKQKPGKPLYFGKKENKIIFGLPGNPSSVLSCFYQYVLLALQMMMHKKDPFIQTTWLPLSDSYTKTAGLTHFLKGLYDKKEATEMQAQESYRLSSFALANCMLEIPADATTLEKGALVSVHILPK